MLSLPPDYLAALPSIVFFNPNRAFIDCLLKEVENRKIVDVGAGTGHMSAVLTKEGFKVLAIDLLRRSRTKHQVVIKDATTFDYPKDSTPIMARPCHNDWVELSIRRALTTTRAFLYAGLEENIMDDLGGLYAGQYKLERILDNAGDDDELVVKITKR